MSYNNFNNLNPPQPQTSPCNCNTCVTMSHDTGYQHQFTGNFQSRRSTKALAYVVLNPFCILPILVEISDMNDVISAQYVSTPSYDNPYTCNPQSVDHTFLNMLQDIRNVLFPQENPLMAANRAPIPLIANIPMRTYDNYDMANASSQLHTATPSYEAQFIGQSDHVNQQNFQNPSHYPSPNNLGFQDKY
ncbi:unnamed protein product [Rhizophagus irregularis]|uniref:Uncharacterized protein n=1 Tax=Rhizophagus irregularis TaxID=588596 RepID=A0A2N1MPX2_9GLOM|nr:hypothetical protein RhiirC2_869648 [Rhizophagus irregularis]CAB4398807.1 unnamed protein product [Rhizophagus irregularis]CAB5368472.1 unnamed protein product [Rhizophagus irregularis]